MRGAAWTELRLCHLEPTEIDRIFFDGHQHGWDEAKALCGQCPVQESCLADTARTRNAYGFQGGEPPAARRRRLGISVWGPAVELVLYDGIPDAASE